MGALSHSYVGSTSVLPDMEVRVINSSACYEYVMWAELSHCHFLYVPAVSNIVTTGNSTGTKNILNGTVPLGLSLVSSLLFSSLLL